MIISHKYKFIFIKNYKVASSSCEVFLAKMCGSEDVITPVNPPIPEHVPRNHSGFKNHLKAARIRTLVDPKVWDNYFKFTIERNPFDKMVSWYFWNRKQGYEDNFKQFVLDCKEEKMKFVPGFGMYALEGKPIIDFIGKYENLEEDLKFVCNKLNLPFGEKIPKIHTDIRKNKSHYSSFYDSKTKRIVERQYSKILSYFHYSFENITNS